MRISKRRLQDKTEVINTFTSHKVKLLFIEGISKVNLTINGNEYPELSNKEAYQILEPYTKEALYNCMNK